MGVIRKNITVLPRHEEFVNQRNINLSGMIQNHLDELMNDIDGKESNREQIIALQKNIEHWKKVNSDAMEFMKSQNVFRLFCESKGYSYGN